MIFENCQALRQSDIVVAQLGDDDGKTIEHNEKHAADHQQQSESGIGDTQLVRRGFQHAARAREDQQGRGSQ